MIKWLVLFITVVLFCGKSEATIYWVSNTGTQTNASNCSGSTPIDGTAACTLSTANAAAQAGDTVYLRGGDSSYEVYNITAASGAGEGIQPDNSGTSYAAMITYSTYNDEMVHLQGNADSSSNVTIGIYLHHTDYIKVTGSATNKLKISKCYQNVVFGPNAYSVGDLSGYTRYNEVAYVWATDTAINSGWAGTTAGNSMYKNSQYNWLHHCLFERHGYQQYGDLFVVGMMINWTGNDTSADNFNIIEDCEFARAGHSAFFPAGKYNVYRRNYIHNEPWTNVGESYYYGFRGTINHQNYTNSGHNVFEKNRIGHAGVGPSGITYGSTGAAWCNSSDLMRYNDFFNNGATAFEFRGAQYAANGYVRNNDNYLYNNTFYYNGYNAASTNYTVVMLKYDNRTDYYTGTPINWQACQNNVIKNNLFYDNWSNNHSDLVVDWGSDYGSSSLAAATACPSSSTQGCNIISNNFNGTAVGQNIDPKFNNVTLSNYDSWALPDLSIQSDSPAKDQGIYLTQASGSGSTSTTLIVDDAKYFQDGKFGSASGMDPTKLPMGVTLQADYIAIGTVSNTVQISSINYATNTITLASAKTWSDNDNIWISKISDGTVVLSGTAPDMGAYEYASGTEPAAPTKVRIIMID